MKKTVTSKINEIRHIVSKMPKTLNEAVYEDFGGLSEDEELGYKKPLAPEAGAEAMPQEEPMTQVDPEQNMPAPEETPQAQSVDMAMNDVSDMPEDKEEGPDSLNVEQFVDDIRKKSLRGMAQLAENPDDERYQLLKKIWQICDKKPEQQTAFSNPNNPQPVKKI